VTNRPYICLPSARLLIQAISCMSVSFQWEATVKLPTGKAVTGEVAAAAAAAEAETEAANDPRAKTNPRGVSAALDMAAKHNCGHESTAFPDEAKQD
jgi:hypothetical protein